MVRRIVNWSFEGREVCRVTSLLVMLERSGSVRAGAQPYLGVLTTEVRDTTERRSGAEG